MGGEGENGGLKRRFSKLAAWQQGLVVAASVATILATVATIVYGLPGFLDDLDGSSSAEPAVEATPRPARLEVVDLSVREVEGPYEHRSRLEVTLHNEGGRLVVIDGAQVEVRQVRAVRSCFAQASLPVSNRYGALLPTDAEPGDSIEVPLHQQVGADAADRFRIVLGADAGTDDELTATYLFDLEVSLLNDGPRSPLPLGRVLVMLPSIPRSGQYYWTETTAETINRAFRPDDELLRYFERKSLPCWHANTAILRRLLAAHALRSDQLDEIADTLVTPDASELESRSG